MSRPRLRSISGKKPERSRHMMVDYPRGYNVQAYNSWRKDSKNKGD